MDYIVPVTTTIEGFLPGLLMHRWAEQAEDQKATRPVNFDRGTAREEATPLAYVNDDNQLYIPTSAFSAMLRNAGRRHKQASSRQSLTYIIPAAIIMTSEIALLHDKHGEPIIDFEIDSRPVVIPATKGRIMRHRPKVEQWRTTFSFEIDTQVLGPGIIKQLLEEGGRRIGILDYRPERGGPYGRFHVINWQEGAE